jgi:hypothetical protein
VNASTQNRHTYRGVLSQARQQGEASEFVDSVVGHVQLHQHLYNNIHLMLQNSQRQQVQQFASQGVVLRFNDILIAQEQHWKVDTAYNGGITQQDETVHLQQH